MMTYYRLTFRIIICMLAMAGVAIVGGCGKDNSIERTNMTAQKFHTWAMTPPMGWNSWDCYGTTISEVEVKANADFMAANLKKHGWEYIVVDAQWFEPLAIPRSQAGHG
jgi:alpha-galactosidase